MVSYMDRIRQYIWFNFMHVLSICVVEVTNTNRARGCVVAGWPADRMNSITSHFQISLNIYLFFSEF
jgi:hypothetical protein